MKKILIIALALTLTAVFISGAFAVPPGKTVEFKGGGLGKVVFDGKKHSDAGNKCNDCHPKIFQMKKGTTTITMKDINAGKSCGACHNGEKAFKSTNCKKCHVK